MSGQRFLSHAAALLVTLLAGTALVAQSDRGAITGTVSDQAGAVVPGAEVNVLNTASGATYNTVTTETGNYTIPSLPSGNYDLTVNRSGFGKHVQTGIPVQVAVSLRIEVVLQVGAKAESVTVTAHAPLLRTESAEQSFNITGDQINALPLTQGSAGLRNPIAFAQLTPGMSVPATNTTGKFQARVNGLPSNTYRTLVDGQDITNSIDPSHLSESHPSMEALQEVSLASSHFAAEFGRVSGGLFNLTFNRTQINTPDSTNALTTPTRNSTGAPASGFGRINAGSALLESALRSACGSISILRVGDRKHKASAAGHFSLQAKKSRRVLAVVS
jgi:hypothetical protein